MEPDLFARSLKTRTHNKCNLYVKEPNFALRDGNEKPPILQESGVKKEVVYSFISSSCLSKNLYSVK